MPGSRKLIGEIKPGARIGSNRYGMGEEREDVKEWVAGNELYVYIVPAHVTGETT